MSREYTMNNAARMRNASGQSILTEISSSDIADLGFEYGDDFKYDALRSVFVFKRKGDRDRAAAMIGEMLTGGGE